MIRGVFSERYCSEASYTVVTTEDGSWVVNPPSRPWASWFLRRTFAKVPRTITSWWPRRAPYVLKSVTATPCASKYFPAGESAGISPAGEMWSVETRSPSRARAREPSTTTPFAGSQGVGRSRYGARARYVESARHPYSAPVGGSRDSQL